MRVAITGSTGLIGTALVRSLRSDGHEVVRLVRGRPALEGSELAVPWDPVAGTIDPVNLVGADAVVHLAGRSIGAKRWSADEKRELVESRTKSTDLLARTLADLDGGPRTLLSGSAIGWYGDRGDVQLTESSESGDGFLADLCRQWEAATAPAEAAGLRVAHLRTGLVLSGEGGFLTRPVQLFKLGLGGRLGSGRQWWSWIAMEDEVRAIRFLLDGDLAGPVNLTGPEPLTNAEFTKVLGGVLHRPTIFPAPELAIRTLLGRELADEVILAGQRVLPRRLLDAGFEFSYPEAGPALEAALG
jgi:uncharacterized protein (TIGR01777 family)